MADTKTDTKPSPLSVPRAPGLAALADAFTDAVVDVLQVGIITDSNDQTIAMLREFRSLIPEDVPHTIRRTNGQQRLTFPHGGEICFYSTRQSIRGRVLDRVYATEFEAERKYWPLVCTRAGGKVVLY